MIVGLVQDPSFGPVLACGAGGITAEQYRAAIGLVAADPGIDAVIAIFIQPLATRLPDVARAIAAAAREPGLGKPVLAVLMSADDSTPSHGTDALRLPIYASPEPAAIALARAAGYGAWRAAPPSSVDRPDGIDHDEAAALIAVALGRADAGWLSSDEATGLLGCYGVRVAEPGPAADGVEMIVGLVQDPSFGPVLACGAGGVTAELIHDVSVRLTPLSERDASEMVRELRTYPLLAGYRGAPPADVPALEDLLLRLGTLAEDLPQVIELDCNPVRVGAHGAVVVEARVRVAPAEVPRPLGARR